MRQAKDWNKLICEWENSDLSVETFCKNQQISVSSFYKHKRKLTQSTECVFTPVVVKSNDTISFIVNGINITCDCNDIAAILEAAK